MDGIIVSPLSADSVGEAVNRAVAAGIPVVCTNTDIEGTGRLCYVGEDAAKASRIAGRIMGEFLGGAGEIAVITSTSAMRTGTYFLKVRETGFQGYMAENFPGIHIVESVPSLENPAMTYQMTLELLRRQPELRGVYVVGGGVRSGALFGKPAAAAGSKWSALKIIRKFWSCCGKILSPARLTATLCGRASCRCAF